jgi:hypothetical protein
MYHSILIATCTSLRFQIMFLNPHAEYPWRREWYSTATAPLSTYRYSRGGATTSLSLSISSCDSLSHSPIHRSGKINLHLLCPFTCLLLFFFRQYILDSNFTFEAINILTLQCLGNKTNNGKSNRCM